MGPFLLFYNFCCKNCSVVQQKIIHKRFCFSVSIPLLVICICVPFSKTFFYSIKFLPTSTPPPPCFQDKQLHSLQQVDPESILWFIEDQAFSPSYDLALPPPLLSSPFPSISLSGDTQEDWERETTWWQEREVEGGGGGAKSYEGEKAWCSINHSILPGLTWAGGGEGMSQLPLVLTRPLPTFYLCFLWLKKPMSQSLSSLVTFVFPSGGR